MNANDNINLVPNPGWHWRNCRSISVSLHFLVWPWAFGAARTGDVYGGQMRLHVGMVGLTLEYSIGNCSSYGLDRLTALSEAEAFARSAKFEERR